MARPGLVENLPEVRKALIRDDVVREPLRLHRRRVAEPSREVGVRDESADGRGEVRREIARAVVVRNAVLAVPQLVAELRDVADDRREAARHRLHRRNRLCLPLLRQRRVAVVRGLLEGLRQLRAVVDRFVDHHRQ